MNSPLIYSGKQAKNLCPKGIVSAKTGVVSLIGDGDAATPVGNSLYNYPVGSLFTTSLASGLWIKTGATENDWTSIPLALVPQAYPAQEILVAKSGGQYTAIQDAINSISDASSSKPYAISVAPGVYTENITLKDWVFIRGVSRDTVYIFGSVSANITGVSGLGDVAIYFTNTADGQTALSVTGTGIFSTENATISISGTANSSVTAMSIAGTAGIVYGVDITDRRTNASITKDFVGIYFNTTSSNVLLSSSVSSKGAFANGNICLVKVTNTASMYSNSTTLLFETTAAFSGTAHTCCVVSATSKPRIFQGLLTKLVGVSGGTASTFSLNSSGNSGEVQYSGCTAFVSGFTNQYVSDTALGDTQKIWLNSTNQMLPKNGQGLAIVTPYDLIDSGFVEWSSVAGDSWSFVPGTRIFTLLKRCTGIVKSAPVVVAANQTVTLTNYAVNMVYSDDKGVLQVATSTPSYSDVIPLFQVYTDGTNYLVKKENHPVSVNTGISSIWHGLIGTLLTNNGGGNITTLVAANRTVKMVGATVAQDHGLSTTIPDSAGAAISFSSIYTGASGTVIDATGLTAIPSKWQNTATTVANAANNDRIVVRVGVILDNINSSSPQYVFVYNNAVYGSNSAAAAAVAANNFTAFPTGLTGLEVLNLGSVTIQADGAGGGTIVATTPAKQVFGATFAAGALSTSAGQIINDTSNFNGILSASETTVQQALDVIDNLTHSTIPGLQGGTISQYYHMTSAQHAIATQAASASVSGYVNTSAQTFAGLKTFQDGIVVSKSIRLAHTTITATGSISADVTFVDCNHASVAIEATLPTAASLSGKIYVITRTNLANVRVLCTGSETINGSAFVDLPNMYSSLSIHSDGTNWIIH